jgi:hypothetical protein
MPMRNIALANVAGNGIEQAGERVRARSVYVESIVC